MKRIFLYLACVFAIKVANGQTEQFVFQDEVENLVEAIITDNEDADVEQLLEELLRLHEHPVNINQAGRKDLEKLYFLSALQIENLIGYRRQYGQIYSPYELNSVEGFEPETIELLQGFVFFGDMEARTVEFSLRQEIMLRGIRLLEKQKAYREPRKYEGSQEKLYFRYRLNSSSVRAGVTAEKDAGEPFFNGANSEGFDYYSAFVNMDFGHGKHQLYLGDYLVRFGQGLTAWQGFALSKSAEVGNVAKFNQGIRSYSSTDENNFMRGIAAGFSLGDFQWHTFVSHKNFDANRDRVEGRTVFTSFQSSGLHRTASEIEDKNSVGGTTLGTDLTYSADRFSLGLTGIHFRYDLPLEREDTDYNLFLFEGKQLSNLGINYQWGFNRYFLFGEAAWSSPNGWATLHGLQANPADQLELSILYRNIGKKYNSPIAAAFTENSRVNDEQGIYLGAVIHPLPKISLKLYADFFEHKWIQYTTVAPARGKEYLAQVKYQLAGNWEAYTRYFYEIRPVKANGEYTKINLDQVRQKLRFHLEGKLGEQFFLKSRAEFSWYEHDEKSKGWMVFQDVGFNTKSAGSRWWLRTAYFDTDNYDSRIYAYENDLLYQFSVPAFYGQGVRIYLNGKVKICEKIDFWIKAARSWYSGADTVGTGYSEIEGNTRTEVKFQLRFKF